MNEQNTLYKLMVLYMLRSIDFSLTYAHISNFILEREYTDYFTLQSALSELQESSLIHVEVINGTSYYMITPAGEEMIRMFLPKVSLAIRSDIDSYLKENHVQMHQDVSVLSESYRTTEGSYEVRCRVREKKETLIDMRLTVPDRMQAEAIEKRWKEKCQNIYEYLMQELMC
jgi:DNA-binding PadR family transcriptional regulator